MSSSGLNRQKKDNGLLLWVVVVVILFMILVGRVVRAIRDPSSPELFFIFGLTGLLLLAVYFLRSSFKKNQQEVKTTRIKNYVRNSLSKHDFIHKGLPSDFLRKYVGEDFKTALSEAKSMQKEKEQLHKNKLRHNIERLMKTEGKYRHEDADDVKEIHSSARPIDKDFIIKTMHNIRMKIESRERMEKERERMEKEIGQKKEKFRNRLRNEGFTNIFHGFVKVHRAVLMDAVQMQESRYSILQETPFPSQPLNSFGAKFDFSYEDYNADLTTFVRESRRIYDNWINFSNEVLAGKKSQELTNLRVPSSQASQPNFPPAEGPFR